MPITAQWPPGRGHQEENDGTMLREVELPTHRPLNLIPGMSIAM
jgi:hypothetical protein